MGLCEYGVNLKSVISKNGEALSKHALVYGMCASLNEKELCFVSCESYFPESNRICSNASMMLVYDVLHL